MGHTTVARLGWIVAVCTASLALAACAQVTPVSVVPASTPASAAIAVYATGADDAPLRDALIYLHPLGAPAPAPPARATLDVMARQFEPLVLPVPAGSTVTFHNLDDVDHDLYSFSEPRPFSLHLPANGGGAPLLFAHPGLVTLGCKVHNWMVGYIYVMDTPYYGKTDDHGYLRLAGLPPGRYTLGLWQARAPDHDDPRLRAVTLAAGSEQAVLLHL